MVEPNQAPPQDGTEPESPDVKERTRVASEDRIHDFIMRGGGEPFGRPYELHTPSLTERVVSFFKQRSFFGFETFERPGRGKRSNKFTRYGSTRFRGSYKSEEEKPKGSS